MRKMFFIVALIAFVNLIAGCTDEKCYVCTIAAASTTHCESDFANATEFEAYIEVIESGGATCTVQ